MSDAPRMDCIVVLPAARPDRPRAAAHRRPARAYASPEGWLGLDAQLVERGVEVGRITVDPVRPRGGQLIGAVAAGEKPHAEHPRPSRGEEVPDGVADHVTVADGHPEALLTGEEQVR